ncbi:hypothetical protein [Ruegeria atlantica]|uniref:hypothetical protein n=1 Tax=Ruegeria atlantica TaxID=81569 RepID=UPI00147FCE63|nr:hypothetical protein [Ruegeria atlantica]
MLKRIAKFSEQEDGAVTVDWVVLTAAIVGMGVFIGLYIAQPVRDVDASNGRALTSVATQTSVQEITVNFSAPDS